MHCSALNVREGRRDAVLDGGTCTRLKFVATATSADYLDDHTLRKRRMVTFRSSGASTPCPAPYSVLSAEMPLKL